MSNYSESFKALGNPHRLEMFKRVVGCCNSGCACGDVEICISSLAEGLGISKATVSHHVKVLSEAGLIKLTKQGREVYCEVNRGQVKQLALLLTA